MRHKFQQEWKQTLECGKSEIVSGTMLPFSSTKASKDLSIVEPTVKDLSIVEPTVKKLAKDVTFNVLCQI